MYIVRTKRGIFNKFLYRFSSNKCPNYAWNKNKPFITKFWLKALRSTTTYNNHHHLNFNNHTRLKMLSLWYAVLTWKEYKGLLLDKKPKTEDSTGNASNVQIESGIIPIPITTPVEKIKPSSPKPIPQPSPPKLVEAPSASSNNTHDGGLPSSVPKVAPQKPPSSLDPPPKPPRSPSPHPMKTENFDDIEFDSEESEEEDEENSVIDYSDIHSVGNAINKKFLNNEINNLENNS